MDQLRAPPLLKLEAVEKTFPNGTVALKAVDLALHPGRVHGLLGANGAGKSTLIKILSGALAASGGRITWRGAPVEWRSPSAARAAGVGTIHQHIPLVPTLSVLENIFLGDPRSWRRDRTLSDEFARLTASVGYDLDPEALVGDLSIGERQMVAILQALGSGADLIVMDEPTASLANEEREIVYATVRRLTEVEGKAILFVSHFLDEIVALTDEVTVLRDGRAVLRARTADIDEKVIADAIVGRAVAAMTRADADPGASAGGRPVVLEVTDLASPGRLAPMSLDVHAGEVVGIAGFLGSGRSELLHAIFRADRRATGEVRLAGRSLPLSTGRAVEAGMALVPEDRTRQGLVPQFEIWRNMSLPHLEGVAWRGVLPQRGREIERASEGIRRLGIKAGSPEALVSELSGGNAQKVTVARWLFGDTKLFLLDEPTAGIDVGAKADILTLIRTLAAAGIAIIIVSSEFEELLAVADRLLVMREGRVVAERAATSTNDQELVLLAGGNQ